MPEPIVMKLALKYGSVRRLAVAYARGRLTPEEECAIETDCTTATLGVFAALALVDDRRDPVTAWKP